MATKSPQSARSSSRSTSSRAGRSTRANPQPPRSSTRPPSRSGGKASSRSSKPATNQKRSRTAVARNTSTPWSYLFDGHGHDVLGVACLLAAVLVALGVWLGAAGPLGAGLETLTRGLVGVYAVVVPVVLVLVGVLLIRGRQPQGPTAPRRSRRRPASAGPDDARAEPTDADGTALMDLPVDRTPARVAGAVLAAVVLLGAAQLLAGQDLTISADGVDAFAGAGGLLGAAIGVPLVNVVGQWGAWAVLVALAVLAVALLSGRPVRQLATQVARGFRPAVGAVVAWLRQLFVVGGSGDEAAPEVSLYDQDAAGGERRRRPARRTASAGEADDQDAPAATTADDEAAPSAPSAVAPGPTPPVPTGSAEQLEIDLPPGAAGSSWKLPPANSLSLSPRATVDTKAVEARGQQLEAALAEHGVETRLVGMVVGPTVTRYELELGVGVKVARVTTLAKDIAYALASPDVRILAPIPGRQAIGIEVPNEDRKVVNLGDILSSPEAKAASHPLEVGVGRDITGSAVMMNLSEMPHLLIAGQTGAGKSSCINSIITSVMMRSTPDQLRLILVDPKRVELTQYNRIPHLLTQVVTDPRKASNALNWAVKEMDRRYDLLSEVGARDIGSYNASYDAGELQPGLGEEREFQRMTYILIVVDELNDLMMTAPRDVEDAICRIAQKARAVGIHLVIATQRPSVNVITGTIKANIPARLAFAVASATDSKVILDTPGAERLVGKGDMLLIGSGSSVPHRIQGAWVDEKEVATIAAFWRRQAPAVEVAVTDDVQGDQHAAGPGGAGQGGGGGGAGDDDTLLEQAMELVVTEQLGSTSMLQRRLKVGFARAGRLMDLLEQRGVVGPSEGSKARAVLITPEELAAMRGGSAPADTAGDTLESDPF